MKPTLFWAWQNDAENNVCRGFIKNAAEKALKVLIKAGEVQDAPRLDHATNEVSGTPELAGTIYTKIEAAGLFLGDVTLVGRIGEKKRTPNPNVLLETGFAAHCMGWDRVILVMNTHEQFGPPEDLPFDLKNRRFPLTYTLGRDDDKVPVREQLVENLTDAIQDALSREHNAVDRVFSQFSFQCFDFLSRYAEREDGSPASEAKGDPVTQLNDIRSALDRFLTINVIRADHEKYLEGKSTFRWTYHGSLVLKKLGYRAECDGPVFPGKDAKPK